MLDSDTPTAITLYGTGLAAEYVTGTAPPVLTDPS